MNNGKKSFVFLVSLFVAPILLGTLLFFNLDRLGIEKGSVNYGELVHPALPLKISNIKVAGEEAKQGEVISKKWTMLYFIPDNCDSFCTERLALLKRVRLLTNEQMRRVRTTVISGKNGLLNIDMSRYTNMVVASLHGDTDSFFKQFPDKGLHPIYLIDPLGNLMMYYTQEKLDIKKMLKDINRLLKYSRIG